LFDEIIERSKLGSFDSPGSNVNNKTKKVMIRRYAQQCINKIVNLLGPAAFGDEQLLAAH